MKADQRPRMARIFFSADEPRLRAFWRLTLHGGLILTFLLVLGIPLAMLALFTNSGGTLFTSLEWSAIWGLLAILLATWVARIKLDRRSMTSLGLRRSRRAMADLITGFSIPALLLGLIFLLYLLLGWLKVDGYAWHAQNAPALLENLVVGLLMFIAVGIQEEVLSRGYHLQNLMEGINLPWGVILSSAIFAGLHLANPHSGLLPMLGIFAAGLLFAFAWLRTRQLWLAIGLHIGWNFFEGTIYGFPVSGTPSFSLIRTSITGPVVLNGGLFGPEGGLLILPIIALGALLVWLYTRNRAQNV